jgi:hypothetical protein
MDIVVAAFDDPTFFKPRHHFGAESILPAWLDTHGLPRHRSDDHGPLVQRWEAAVGRMPQ